MGRTINPALLSGSTPQENDMGNSATTAPADPKKADPAAVANTDANAGTDPNEPKAAQTVKIVGDTLGPQVTNSSGDPLSQLEELHGVKVGAPAIVFNPQIRPMRDPHTGDRFPVGVHKRVPELGVWTATQIGAGILEVGDESKLGNEPKTDNADFDGPGSEGYVAVKAGIDVNANSAKK